MAFNTKISLTNDKVCQADGGILTLCGDTSVDAVGTLQYATNQCATYVARSIVDAAYVTGKTTAIAARVCTIEGKYLTGATNGIGFTGKQVCLGGALAANTVIGAGSFSIGFNNTIINLTGGTCININAPASGLKLITAPSTGANTDTILVRASDGTVKGISGGAALSSAITGATNGLTKKGQTVILGGALTGDTTIGGGSLHALSLCNSTLLECSTGTIGICATGVVTLASGVASGFVIAAPTTGAIYNADYSAGYLPRSLVDASYVTGKTSQAILTANNGLSKIGKNVQLGGNLTGATTIGAGAQPLTLNVSTLYLTGGTAVRVGAPAGGLKLITQPSTGGVTDYILVRASDGTVKQVAGTSLGAITGATNGLTKSGQKVVLGGSLTGDTEIGLNTHKFILTGGTHQFGICATPTDIQIGSMDGNAGFSIFSGLTVSSQSNGLFYSETKNCFDVYTVDVINTAYNCGSGFYMDACNVSFCGNSNFCGVVYHTIDAPVYRANFVCNSLVDAAWVTGRTSTSGIQTVNNGLTKKGTNAILGGSLTGATTIGAGAQPLTLNVSTLYLTGGTAVRVGAPAGGLKLLTQPSTGANTDSILVRASDGTVKTISGGAALSSAITGATNGLCKKGQTVILGGALTGDTTISAHVLTVSSSLIATDACYFKFNANPTIPSTCCGTLYYKDNALNFAREFTGVTLQIGEETVVKVCNVGSAIANGVAVYINGANGNLPTIAPSNGSIDTQALHTMGLTTMPIGSNAQGYVTLMGHVHDMNTNAWSVGTQLFLAPTAGGTLTSTMPSYPNEAIMIGTVIVQSSTAGQVLVNPMEMTEYLDYGTFTGYTATTKNTLNAKLNTSVFNAYTGATTPVINGLVTMCAKAVTGATNGLGKSDCHTVCLGGSLSAPTTISGAQLLTLDDLNGICMSVANTTDFAVNAKSNGAILLKSQSGTVASSYDMTNAVGIAIDFNATPSLMITDNTAIPRGIQYASDYSGTFCTHSLVDKYYVDSIATGLNVHGTVVAATTPADGNLALNGTGGTIDGVPISSIVALNNRILVKNQTSAKFNGIYSASTGQWGRTSDYDFNPSGEVSNGDLIPVLSGTTNANSQWINVSVNPIVSGASINFSIFSQQQGIVQGDGICVTTAGANRCVAVRLGGSNCGLTLASTALALDLTCSTFRVGLSTAVGGKVDVRATQGSASGTEIGVRIATGGTNTLYVDSAAVVTALGTPIITAGNGLTKVGSNVVLGGTLTGNTTIAGNTHNLTFSGVKTFALSYTSGATITDSSTPAHGLQYAADYSGNYTARSLIDCAYANSLITSGVLAANGLTKIGNTVILGGSVSGGTSVCNGAGKLNFLASNNGIEIISTCSAIHAENNMAYLNACTSAGSLSGTVCVAATGIVSLTSTAAGSGVLITAPATGAIYAANYGSTFIARSLVDAAYVTGKTSLAILTASNGLTKTGTNVTLGGTLAADTTINGAQTLRLNITNLNVTGTTNATGALNVTGAIDTNSTLDVLGATTLHSTLIVTGTTTHNAVASYGSDLSPFTARQIPDAAWVTGKTSTAGIQTANNGLRKVGINVQLGGALTGATVICGAGIALNLGCVGSVLGAFTVCSASVTMRSTGTMLLSAGTTVGICPVGAVTIAPTAGAVTIAPTAGAVNITPVGAVLINPSTTVDICPTGALTFCSAGALTFNKVVNYNAQPTFTALSLVNASYVTGLTTNAILTANNGLSKIGKNVQLGGALTGATSIYGNFALCLGTTAAPLGAVNICAASLVKCTSGAYSQYSTTSLTCASSTLDLRSTGAAGFCSTGVATIVGSCVNITPVTDATIFAGNCVMACVGTSTYGKVGANGTSATLLACGAVSTDSCVIACNTGIVYVKGTDSVNISGGVTNGICLTGPVKLVTTPAGGSTSDVVLVRASDGTVKCVTQTSLGDKNNIYGITAVTGNVTLVDTSTQYVVLVNSPAAPVTITLPATPATGRAYRIKDVGNAAVTNNITINRNGKNIDGAAADALINTSGGSIELVYSGDGASPLGSWYTLSFVN